MSLVNSFRKMVQSQACRSLGCRGGMRLTLMSLDNSPLRESYRADAMHSVQGDPSSLYGDVLAPEENLVALPLLGSAPAATQQRRLLICAGGYWCCGVWLWWLVGCCNKRNALPATVGGYWSGPDAVSAPG